VKLVKPHDEDDLAMLIAACAARYGRPETDVKVIHAPYRICPIGAHIDHQLGPVSAIGVEQGIRLAFVPGDDITITSRGYPQSVTFALNDPLIRQHDWADYARGALAALKAEYSVTRGAALLIEGELSEAGISSSAAVGLGYLLALAEVNDLSLTLSQLIEMDRQIENDFLGLKNGVLDQSAVALAKPQQLTIIDCKQGTHHHVAQPQPFEFLAVYSGVREALVTSGKFNNRVEECLLAGASLHALETGEQRAGVPLGEIGELVWQRHQHRLPASYYRRATHFYGESQRVLAGAQAWQEGNRELFGRLMVASCESSINNYETGSPEMIHLFELLAQSEGVYGARFSGAGFRGCAVALIDPHAKSSILHAVQTRYRQRFPQLADDMWAIHTRAAQGLQLL
jgi:galacturonokinase